MSGAALKRPASEWALRLVEFNLHIARFAHRSWYDEALPPQFAALLEQKAGISARIEPQVSQWLLHRLGLQETFDWEMSEPQKRLWLLDAEGLDRLALLVSLAMHRQWLLQIIDGARWRRLREVVGAGNLSFVLDDVPEESFHHPAPVVSFDHEPDTWSSSLRADGARTLLHLLETSWRAVRERAVLRFERGTLQCEAPPLAADRNEHALELICGQLIPRRLPEWAWLF